MRTSMKLYALAAVLLSAAACVPALASPQASPAPGARALAIPPQIEPTIRGNAHTRGSEAKAETYRAIEDSLELVLDSTVEHHRCASHACAKVRAQIASAIFQKDSLRAVRLSIEREIGHDLAMLDSTAKTKPLGDVAPAKVPPVPVDSNKFRVRRLPPATYLALVAAGTQLGRLDRDPGGYDATRFYKDKFVAHYSIGYALEVSAERAGVHPLLALAGTCAGAQFFDRAQGFYNRRDVLNGCGGAATSYAVGWLGRRLL